MLLVGTSPEAQAQATELSQKLVSARSSESTFQLIHLDSPEGAEFQLDTRSSYLLRQLDGPGQQPPQVVWRRTLTDTEQAWADFQASRFDVAEGQLIGWARATPRDRELPLRRGEAVEFYLGGLPKLSVEAKLGGQRIPLTEEAPGYYSGRYTVQSEDRVEAMLTVRASDENGLEETRDLALLSLQGLSTPGLTGLQQLNYSEWLLQGQAPPGSSVEISVAIRLGGLFGASTLRKTVTAQTDENGTFQASAPLGTLSSSPKGIVKVKAIDENGVEVLGPEQEVRFASRVVTRPVYYGDPWGFGYRRPFWGRGVYRRGCR